jgi:hypothetical protein
MIVVVIASMIVVVVTSMIDLPIRQGKQRGVDSGLVVLDGLVWTDDVTLLLGLVLSNASSNAIMLLSRCCLDGSD